MSRRKSQTQTNEMLRRFVQQAESYNRCMFAKTSSPIPMSKSSTEHVEFCQDAMKKLQISGTKKISTIKGEKLLADVVSDRYQYETSHFRLNSIEQCCVVSIISPYAFSVQLTRDFVECDEFFKTINEFYNSNVDLQIPSEYLRENLLCVTWDERASTWNRSQILEFDLIDDTVNVFFVDFNSWEENVSRSRLRFILTKFSSRPVRLISCRLASIVPFNPDQQSNDVVSKTFENVLQNCQCDVQPLYQAADRSFYVKLFAAHDEAYVCVNDFLVHCRMAQPIGKICQEKNAIFKLDHRGEPMHSIIALYWKAGETMRETETKSKKIVIDRRSTALVASLQSKTLLLTKTFSIDGHFQMIFARFNSYIMLPWFTISSILRQYDEEKIRTLAQQFGFKPIIIDPLSHPLLCSQLLKLSCSPSISSQISLYSIDCVRRLFDKFGIVQPDIDDLLNEARLAEASDDSSFWEIDDRQVELRHNHSASID